VALTEDQAADLARTVAAPAEQNGCYRGFLRRDTIIAVDAELRRLRSVEKAAREYFDVDEAFAAAYDRAGGISAELCIRRAHAQTALMVVLAEPQP
jgi:hypothetical protein